VAQRIDCKSVGHIFEDAYSFAVKRGRSLIVVQQCEICGVIQVAEHCRDKRRRRMIVTFKDTKFYKRRKEEEAKEWSELVLIDKK